MSLIQEVLIHMQEYNEKPNYEIWIKSWDRKMYRLPVNPEKIDVSCKSRNKKIELMSLGEATLLKEKGLKEIKFSSILPKRYGPYCEYVDIPAPWDVIELIEENRGKLPIWFVITNTPINMMVTVESFSYKEKSGDVGTLHYEMTVKEFRNLSIPGSKGISVNKTFNNKIKEKEYTIKEGDYLIKIAKKVGVDDWRKIAELNNIKAPYTIYTGDILRLP